MTRKYLPVPWHGYLCTRTSHDTEGWDALTVECISVGRNLALLEYTYSAFLIIRTVLSRQITLAQKKRNSYIIVSKLFLFREIQCQQKKG